MERKEKNVDHFLTKKLSNLFNSTRKYYEII